MGIFNKKQSDKTVAALAPQTRATGHKSFFDDYMNMHSFHGDLQLYKTLRESVPIIDAGIRKLCRLVGGFDIICGDKSVQRAVDDFVGSVSIDGTMNGLEAFITAHMDELLTYGTAAAEMLVHKDGKEALSIYRPSLMDISLKRDEESPTRVLVCTNSGALAVPVEHQELLLLSVLNPDAGSIAGNSILKGLPFVSSVLMKIYNTIGLNFERVGNLRFAVTYKPSSESGDKMYAKERAMQIASQWSQAMQSGSDVKDFIAVGDVDIKVIGADNQILSSDIPVRQMLEQIIAKLGLPPFMLGLSWSTTERMSAQQADMLTSELQYYRQILSPVISRILDLFFRIKGFSGGYSVQWQEISLQDEVELSRARLNNAKALEAETAVNKEKGEGA